MTSSLLKMTFTIEFFLDYRDNLGMGIHQFFLGQHTSAARKVLEVRFNQHQVIEDGGGAPTLSYATYLTEPYEVSFPETVTMERISHARLQVILDTILGRNHPDVQGMYAVVFALIYWEVELEECPSCNPILKPNLLALLIRWIHILLAYLITRQ